MVRPDDLSYAKIRINPLLVPLKNLKHRIADLIDLIALPRNRQKYLPAPAATCSCRNI
jgi:hypothetical protein